MGYPGRHNIYNAAIRRMVAEALEEERRFRLEHAGDTDAELLTYLRESTARLRHSPWPGEIPGGSLLKARFGSWDRALAAAGIPLPQNGAQPKVFARVKEEEARQKEAYRQRKAEKKAHAQKRLAAQAVKSSAEQP